jgi:hypothetical protein
VICLIDCDLRILNRIWKQSQEYIAYAGDRVTINSVPAQTYEQTHLNYNFVTYASYRRISQTWRVFQSLRTRTLRQSKDTMFVFLETSHMMAAGDRASSDCLAYSRLSTNPVALRLFNSNSV